MDVWFKGYPSLRNHIQRYLATIYLNGKDGIKLEMLFLYQDHTGDYAREEYSATIPLHVLPVFAPAQFHDRQRMENLMTL